jgi:hypothetical protein
MRAKWMDAVGFALGASLLAAAIQWRVEGADESAFDRVTAAYQFVVAGLAALTLALMLVHYLRARSEVFNAHRDRGDRAESELAQMITQRDQYKTERDDARDKLTAAEVARPVFIGGHHVHYEQQRPDPGNQALREERQKLLSSENPPIPRARPASQQPPQDAGNEADAAGSAGDANQPES